MEINLFNDNPYLYVEKGYDQDITLPTKKGLLKRYEERLRRSRVFLVERADEPCKGWF